MEEDKRKTIVEKKKSRSIQRKRELTEKKRRLERD